MKKLKTLEQMRDYIKDWLVNARDDCTYTQEKLDKAHEQGKSQILELAEYVKATAVYSVLTDLYLAIDL